MLQYDHLHLAGFYSCVYLLKQKNIKKNALHTEEFLELIKKAKEKGLTVSMDPQFHSKKEDSDDNEYLTKLLPHLDIFIPSSYEAYGIFEKDTIKESIKEIRKMMPYGLIIIKNGEFGVNFSTKDDIDGNSRSIPAFKVKNVVDTTGSGCCFIAGFLHKWVQTKNQKIFVNKREQNEYIAEAISYGCAAAKLSVKKVGAFVDGLSREDVDHVLGKN